MIVLLISNQIIPFLKNFSIFSHSRGVGEWVGKLDATSLQGELNIRIININLPQSSKKVIRHKLIT